MIGITLMAKINTRNTRGFTIVELIVVIVVIGILATVAIVSYNGVQNRASKSSYEATAQQIKLKLGEHFTDKNYYPNAKGTTTTAGSVLKYLTDIGSTTLATDFGNTVYTYGAWKTSAKDACDYLTATTMCGYYEISVPVSAWKGSASDTALLIKP